MSNRTTRVLRSAAALCAVVALGGSVRASDGASAVEPKALDLKPVYLQDAAASSEAAPRKPLMALLDKMGVASSLDSAGINMGGVIEGSWTYNFDNPGSHTNFGRSFDVDDQDLTLNQIDVFAEKVAKAGDSFDWGGRVEMMYGSDARFIHSLGLFDHYGAYNVPSADDADNPDNQFDLVQAYLDLALPVGNGLTLRVGKFVTPMGYEVINPSGNLFYSHSFLFNYAIPLTHTGVMATYNLDDKGTNVYAGVTRGWDTSLEDDNDTVDYLLGGNVQLSDKTKLSATIISGADQAGDNNNWRTVVDVILSHTVGDNLTVALNGDYGYERNSHTAVGASDAQWYGIAGYASMTLCKEASLNVRAEYFNDADGARLSAGVKGAQFLEGTVGLSVKPFASDSLWSNLVIRPEVRWDWSDGKVFDDGGDYNQFTAAIDAYFTF